MSDLEFYERYWQDKRFQKIDDESIWKAKMLLSVIPKRDYKLIAEMGCGTSHVLNLVADELKVQHRIGVELSKKALITAVNLYPKLSGLQADVAYVPLKNNSVDLLILSDILEHLPKPVNFLRDVGKVADFLALNIPIERSLFPKLFEKFSGAKSQIETGEHKAGHLFEWTTNEVEKLLGCANLKIINSKLARPPVEFFKSPSGKRNHPAVGRISETSMVNLEKSMYKLSDNIHARFFHTKYFAFAQTSD
jgi:SAM-dependent methyltransferase